MGAGPRGGRGEAFLDALFAYRLPQQLLVLLYKNGETQTCIFQLFGASGGSILPCLVAMT
jgi:hypothetical protein